MKQVGSNDNHALLSTSLRFEPWRDVYDNEAEGEDTDEESDKKSELDAVLRDMEDLMDHAHENNIELKDLEDIILYRRKLLSRVEEFHNTNAAEPGKDQAGINKDDNVLDDGSQRETVNNTSAVTKSVQDAPGDGILEQEKRDE